VGEGVVNVSREGGCVAGWTHEICIFGRLQFSPDGQNIVSGSLDKFVKVWSLSGGKEVASLVDTRKWFGRSPSIPTGNMLFLEVVTSW
jgi:WD40 repeat protein